MNNLAALLILIAFFTACTACWEFGAIIAIPIAILAVPLYVRYCL